MPLQSQQSQCKESNSKIVKIFFLLLHFRKKIKKIILCTVMLDSLDVLKLGHGLSSLKTVFWLNQLGFVKIQKVKLMKKKSANGSGRSFPWAEHFVVSVPSSVAVEA